MEGRIIKVLGIVVMMLFSIIVKAQNYSLHGRPYGDSLALRWQVFEPTDWKKGYSVGYNVYRAPSTRGGSPLGDFKKLNVNPILPIPFDEFEQNDEMLSDSVITNALGLIYMESLGSSFEVGDGDPNDPEALRFLYHSIVCSYDAKAAKVSGLYFTDTDGVSGRFVYRLTFADKNVEDYLTYLTISSSAQYEVNAIDSLDDITHKRKSMITWKLEQNNPRVIIPSYNIYRSDKENTGYKKLNQYPILATAKQEWLDSTKGFFMDTTLEKKKEYYYKVQGTDLFGELTPYSKSYKIREKTYLETAANFISAEEIPKSKVELKWSIRKSDYPQVVSIEVVRAIHPDSLFTPISKRLKKTTTSFIDKKSKTNNYYQVKLFGEAGDSILSPVRYVHRPDSIPPQASNLLFGKSDTLGNVKIYWNKNKEEDIEEYWILRANYKNEEFSHIATVPFTDTMYQDKISIKVMDKYVYYQVIAVDNSFNLANESNIIKVKRPDHIPPAKPVFVSYNSDKDGIQVTWSPSPAKDLKRHVLYKKRELTDNWGVVTIVEGDSLVIQTNYIDQNIQKGVKYYYTMIAVDSSDLKSTYETPLRIKAFDDGLKPKIEKISVIKSTKVQKIKLKWEYAEAGVKRFLIYRKLNDGRLSLYKGVEGDIGEFIENKPKSKTAYTYKVKALFFDGSESAMSDEITIKY